MFNGWAPSWVPLPSKNGWIPSKTCPPPPVSQCGSTNPNLRSCKQEAILTLRQNQRADGTCEVNATAIPVPSQVSRGTFGAEASAAILRISGPLAITGLREEEEKASWPAQWAPRHARSLHP